MTPQIGKRRQRHKCFHSLFSIYCLLTTFASINTQLNIASHNLHGFKKSSAFHKQCIQKYSGVWFGQELWLPEKRLSDLSQLGVQYAARSGMEDALSKGIYAGRPYGGVSVAWSHDLDHMIKPLVNYRHKRIVCVEIVAEPNPLLLASIYMPFYDSSRRQECIAECIETISMLDEIVSDHPCHSVILGGDFNTEFRGNSPFDILWQEFSDKHNLVCCDGLINGGGIGGGGTIGGSDDGTVISNHYTYIHDSLNQQKWNDHFIISSSLIPSTNGLTILDVGDNPSDHLPIMMQLSLKLSTEIPRVETTTRPTSLKWEKCSEDQKNIYKERLADTLRQSPRISPICSKIHCEKNGCIVAIQNEYDSIVNSITKSDKVLPRHKPGVQKHWWNQELTQIRNRSIDIHRLWQTEGKPRSGATNEERLRVRAAYKRALKSAQRAPKQESWNKLHGNFVQKDSAEFWKNWKQLYNSNKSSLHTVVNGVTDKNAIADSFKSHFVKVSRPNSQQRVDQLNEVFQREYQEAKDSHIDCSCSTYNVTLENVLDATFSLRKGKCTDDVSLNAEHFFNAPLSLFDRIQQLFNDMLRHGHVPRQFQQGTIIPIVKDQHGDRGDMNNYRGITIAPILSKIFEHCMLLLFKPFLTTSLYQFGFKKKSSTSHAIHFLRESVDYYTSHGSNVFCSFLDASKAFNRLVHAALFLKLLRRHIPIIFLDIIISWYSNLTCRVRWGDAFSECFAIKAGVRQGGILSPIFYCIYVDDLVDILAAMGIGCHLRDVFFSILLYADDMALISPSLRGLQELLSATDEYCKSWDIMLNPKKTKNIFFGKKPLASLAILQLDGKDIEWVDSWPYLGVTIKSHTTFNCCIDKKVKAFYRAANGILRIEGRSNETIMLQMLETHCLPILTYAIDVIHVANRDEKRRLRVAYNSIFRKLFDYRTWESVTDLQHALQRPTWEELMNERRQRFRGRITHYGIM